MKIMQQHYQSTIYLNKRVLLGNKVDYVYVVICS